MPKLLFELLGDNVDMAQEEVAGLLEVMGLGEPRVLFEDGLMYGLDIGDAGPEQLKVLEDRLGLTRSVGELLLGPEASAEGILASARGADLTLPPGSFAVKPRRFGEGDLGTDASALAGELGALIKEKNEGAPVDLKSPGNHLDLFLSKDLYLSRRLFGIERTPLEDRRVQFREHFSPISLHPKFARACINMARVNNNFLDPFCGTGGFLIEGGLMGITVFGSDIDPLMIKGARKNLEQFGIRKHHLMSLDVEDCGRWMKRPGVPEKGFDAVVADPPYGRSSSTAGEKVEDVFAKAFNSLDLVIRPGGRLLIIVPDRSYADMAGDRFRREKVFEQKVHGSLTRWYCLFSKE